MASSALGQEGAAGVGPQSEPDTRILSNTEGTRSRKRDRLSNALSRFRSLGKPLQPLPSPHGTQPFSSSAEVVKYSSPSTSLASNVVSPSVNILPGAVGELSDQTEQRTQLQDIHAAVVNVQNYSTHFHHGDTYNTTNVTHGTANFIDHISNANFAESSGTRVQMTQTEQGSRRRQDGVEVLALWESLPRRRDASELEPNSYLEGSRESEIQFILNWVDDSESGLALFIHGPAGLGKSTLALHATHRLRKANRLGASISLGSIPVESRNPESVLRLLAREIGERYPQAIRHVVDAIQSCKGAPLEDHFEGMLGNPVCSLKLSHPIVVLFDAFDEWASHVAFLNALPGLKSASSSIKFILLGRSDPRARGLGDESIIPYPLEPVSTAVMEQYLRKQFNSVQWENGQSPLPWQVTRLAKLADGLFVWAMVVCSLLQKRLSRSSPNETLDSILEAGRSLGDTQRLATLYHQAITWLFPEPEDADLFREYLAAILALQEPLPATEFSGLTSIPVRAILSIQSDLKTLQIKHPGGDQAKAMVYPAGSLFHLSFIEYIHSSSTPSQVAFPIPLLDAHSQLAECCLAILPRTLSGSQPPAPSDLPAQQKYAIKYLTTHIYLGSSSVAPGPTVELKPTSLCRRFEQLGTKLLLEWSNLWILLVDPEAETEKVYYTSSQIPQLLEGLGEVLWDANAPEMFYISCLEVAVRLQPEDATMWDTLGCLYALVARVNKSVDASQKAVAAHQYAREAANANSQNDPGRLPYSLAGSLLTRFELLDVADDLDQSIVLYREALRLRPSGHEYHAETLSNLVTALRFRSEQTPGSIDLVDEMTSLSREVVEHWPSKGAEYARQLRDLAISLDYRFDRTGSIADIDEAIRLKREALKLYSTGHPDRPEFLRNLAISLHRRSEATGSTPNINEAIQLTREVLNCRPAGHTDHVESLKNLATSLEARSRQVKSIPDLDEVVELKIRVLAYQPPEHPEHSRALMDLANAYHYRSHKTGAIPDIDEAIRLVREILKHHSPGHQDHTQALKNLATFLHFRSEKTSSIPDIEEAVQLRRDVLTLCAPGGHDQTKVLKRLASSLRLLHKLTGTVAFRDEAFGLLAGHKSA